MKIILMTIIGLILSACGLFLKEDQALRINEKSNRIAEANFKLGVAYLQAGDYERALEKLQKAQKSDPDYAQIYNALGVLYQEIGEYEDAEKYYHQGLELNPKSSEILNNYGRFLCQIERYQEAEKTFIKATENPLYTKPEIVFSNAGTCLLRQNNVKKAEIYFRKALKLQPKVANALISMSRISYGDQKYLSARAYLQRYLEVSKQNPESLWLGIKIEQALGDKDALSSYSLLLKNNFPNSEEAILLKESGYK